MANISAEMIGLADFISYLHNGEQIWVYGVKNQVQRTRKYLRCRIYGYTEPLSCNGPCASSCVQHLVRGKYGTFQYPVVLLSFLTSGSYIKTTTASQRSFN